jgi:hypothetical protein
MLQAESDASVVPYASSFRLHHCNHHHHNHNHNRNHLLHALLPPNKHPQLLQWLPNSQAPTLHPLQYAAAADWTAESAVCCCCCRRRCCCLASTKSAPQTPMSPQQRTARSTHFLLSHALQRCHVVRYSCSQNAKRKRRGKGGSLTGSPVKNRETASARSRERIEDVKRGERAAASPLVCVM